MIYLRIELEKNVFKTIELGSSYVRMHMDNNLDPNMNMGQDIHDMLGNFSYHSETIFYDFICKDGIVDWDHVVCIDDLYHDAFNHYPAEEKHDMKVYIMNDKGNTIESFTTTLFTEENLISK